MKKSIFLLIALLAGALNLFAQTAGCDTIVTRLAGTAQIKFVRYKHIEMVGAFTINSSGDQVRFAQGNLQYRASTNVWRFAEEQYEMLGTSGYTHSTTAYTSGNETAAASRSTQDSWIDLFGWGTSGKDDGETTAYEPWSVSTTNTDYRHAAELNANSDWSRFGVIINGGGASGPQQGLWRTLTGDELTYIFSGRTDASSKYGVGELFGVRGVYLIPDVFDWTADPVASAISAAGFTWVPFSSETTKGGSNLITSSTLWNVLQNAGVVFLPVTGQRTGENVEAAASGGYYWTATGSKGGGYSSRLVFNITASKMPTITLPKSAKSHFGCAVRPVQDL